MGAARDLTEPTLAFRVAPHEQPECEIRVNFGVYAGRNATQAEIDDLARALCDVVDSFSVVAEERHEFGGDVEAMLRQIVIEFDGDDATCDEVVVRAERWAAGCIAARADLGELRET